MWTALSPRLDPDVLCDRLLQSYELQIMEIEACSSSTVWDGFCGLVKTSDEDLQLQPSQSLDAISNHSNTRVCASSSRAQTQRNLPFTTSSDIGIQELLNEAESAIATGDVEAAKHLLKVALHRCPVALVDDAERIINTTIRLEQIQEDGVDLADTVCRAASRQAAGQATTTAFSDSSDSIQQNALASYKQVLKQAMDALARGEARRALQHFQQATLFCSPDARVEQRRIALYCQLLKSKTHI